MTTLLILTGCQDKPSLDPVPGPSETYPIQFGISADLEVESKTVIDDSNFETNKFTALGNLTVDGEQQTDLFGENGVTVENISNVWTYSPLRYWQTGSYVFAGVMPSAAGTASFSANNELTINFGTEGFDLSATQHDLMVAFTPKEVEKVSATDVLLNFEHQLSLVVINGAYKETAGKVRVDKIEVFGNTAKTAGNMVFTHDKTKTKINASYSLDSQSVTDVDNVYQTIEGAWELAPSSTSTNIVSGLLVFPEECDFSIVVTYTDRYGNKDGVQKTKSAALHSNWEPGKKYTYTFNVNLDHISFAEPTVTDWVSGGNVDTGIEM